MSFEINSRKASHEMIKSSHCTFLLQYSIDPLFPSKCYEMHIHCRLLHTAPSSNCMQPVSLLHPSPVAFNLVSFSYSIIQILLLTLLLPAVFYCQSPVYIYIRLPSSEAHRHTASHMTTTCNTWKGRTDVHHEGMVLHSESDKNCHVSVISSLRPSEEHAGRRKHDWRQLEGGRDA